MSRVSIHQLFIPSNGLLECLKTVGVTKVPLSFEQIMDCMKNYIMERRLYDPNSPTQILCGQDPLGKVLGAERFLVSEVIGLLVKQIRAVPSQHVVSQGALKRESQSGACQDSAAGEPKRARLEPDSTASGASASASQTSPIIVHIPPSPTYGSGAETEYSVQARETDVVKDTSDDLWFLNESSDDYGSTSDSDARRQHVLQAAALAAELLRQQRRRRRRRDYSDRDSDCPFEVEYEVEEESDHGGKAASLSSDSDIEEVAQAEILICVNDDDAQFWADSSDSYSSDSEIGDSDLWQCRLCGLQCEPRGCRSAVQRYCTGCWKKRFGWLPDRTERHPPQKKRRRPRRRSGRQMSLTRADRDSSSAKLGKSHSVLGSEKNEASHLASSNTASNSGGSQESFSEPSTSGMQTNSGGSQDSFSEPSTSGMQANSGGSQESFSEPSTSGMQTNSGGSQDSFSKPSTSGMQAPPSCGSRGASSGPSQELTDDWSRPGCSKDGQVEETVAPSSGSAPDMCTICLVRPKCGILVHGRTSHRLSCYQCALQLQKRNQPCPVCRRRIQRVVRNFDA